MHADGALYVLVELSPTPDGSVQGYTAQWVETLHDEAAADKCAEQYRPDDDRKVLLVHKWTLMKGVTLHGANGLSPAQIVAVGSGEGIDSRIESAVMQGVRRGLETLARRHNPAAYHALQSLLHNKDG